MSANTAILVAVVVLLVLLAWAVWTRGQKQSATGVGKTGSSEEKHNGYDFRWYEVGEDNPFNRRILDVRSLTCSVVATTEHESIAKKFLELRGSDGKELIGISPNDPVSTNCDLAYPHNGAELRGVVFKADCMEVKWDIYVYDDIFYFARSWTGNLVYKAYATISDTEFRIARIEYAGGADDDNLATQNVHFLMKTHALGAVHPHAIPDFIADDPRSLLITPSLRSEKKHVTPRGMGS